MVTCEKCNKEFKFKCHLTRHLNNKNGCGILTNKIVNEENPIHKGIKLHTKINNLKAKIRKLENLYESTRCGYCDKLLSSKFNLNYHMNNSCKKRKSLLINIKELEDELEKELEIQEEIHIMHKKEKIKNITNNTNNGTINNTTNNTTNNTINITLNPFGKEDLSHITDANYRKYMLDIFPGFLNFITKIYYDDEMPSNHNICIKNIKSNDGCIFDGKKWNLTDRDELITALINHKTKILNNKYEEFEENNEVSEKLEEAFSHFCNRKYKNKQFLYFLLG